MCSKRMVVTDCHNTRAIRSGLKAPHVVARYEHNYCMCQRLVTKQECLASDASFIMSALAKRDAGTDITGTVDASS